jgi:hypothetical protein
MYRIGCVAIVLFFLFCGCASLAQSQIDGEEAFVATQTWLQYLDEMNYEKLWDESSELRRLKIDKDDFIRKMNGIRAPLGKMIDRDLQLNLRITLIKHYPDGQYRRIVFWSKYEKKDFAREYIILVKEEGQWRVLEFQLT